ncbi:unnamed protein product [Nippostrongylus brasiliensis]|uniref:Uncharacterized protein n=1 Tax=Nippostrongylus brasiliensis TaxID=27835 RepID=A0A0N4Y1G8_NIPBR|nr:unnamed protein product [Nippostrongylus brasiliensis]
MLCIFRQRTALKLVVTSWAMTLALILQLLFISMCRTAHRDNFEQSQREYQRMMRDQYGAMLAAEQANRPTPRKTPREKTVKKSVVNVIAGRDTAKKNKKGKTRARRKRLKGAKMNALLGELTKKSYSSEDATGESKLSNESAESGTTSTVSKSKESVEKRKKGFKLKLPKKRPDKKKSIQMDAATTGGTTVDFYNMT